MSVQVVSGRKGVRGVGVEWGMERFVGWGIREVFNLRDVQGCYWFIQLEGLEGFEGQDLGIWLVLVYIYFVSIGEVGFFWGYSLYQVQVLGNLVSFRIGEVLGLVRGRVLGIFEGGIKVFLWQD